jgi:hypothetical protein
MEACSEIDVFNATEETTNKKVDRIGTDVEYLKDNQRLDVGEYGYISRRVSEKVNEYIRIHGLALTAAQRSKLFKDINRGLNEVTGIKTRSQLTTERTLRKPMNSSATGNHLPQQSRSLKR